MLLHLRYIPEFFRVVAFHCPDVSLQAGSTLVSSILKGKVA